MSIQDKVTAALARLQALQHEHTGQIEQTRKTLARRAQRATVAMRAAARGVHSGDEGNHEDEYTTAVLERGRAESLMSMLDDLAPVPSSTDNDSPRWSGTSAPRWSPRS